MRITRDEMLMSMAHLASERGTCLRLKVGAILAVDSRVVSLGYNGSPPGQPHCTPETCNTFRPCTRTIHAEINAIEWAYKYGKINLSDCTLYVTDSPCINCAKEIVEAGILKVVYARQYRITEGIEWLLKNGVEVFQFTMSPARIANSVTTRIILDSKGSAIPGPR